MIANRVIAALENPKDVLVISNRTLAQPVIFKIATYNEATLSVVNGPLVSLKTRFPRNSWSLVSLLLLTVR
jgi:hypothetical protein